MKKRFEKVMNGLDKESLRLYVYAKSMVANNKGIAKEEILGIAAGLIVAAFVIIPGLRDFAGDVITAMNNWWTTTIATKVFPTT